MSAALERKELDALRRSLIREPAILAGMSREGVTLPGCERPDEEVKYVAAQERAVSSNGNIEAREAAQKERTR